MPPGKWSCPDSSTRTCISSTAASASRRCSFATRRRRAEFIAPHQGVRRDDAARAHGSPAATGITSSGAASSRGATWIDSVTPNNPVWVNRLDGHMALANSRGAACREGDPRDARRRRRHDRARRRRRADGLSRRTTRWRWWTPSRRPARRSSRIARSMRRWTMSPRRASRPSTTWARGTTSPFSSARAQAGRLRHADLCRRSAVDVGAAARYRRGARSRRRLAPHRRAQRLRRRLVRLAHRGDARAVHRRAVRHRPVRQHPRGPVQVDVRRRQGGAARDRPRDRRPRDPRAARHLRARREGRTARAIAASASSTRSTSRRPTFRASRRSASSRACSRTTRSTMAGGPKK